MTRRALRVRVLAAAVVSMTTGWLVAAPQSSTSDHNQQQQQPPPQQPPQRPPVFRGGLNFVLVDVYPTRDGRIVEGLTAADFQVFENGQPQKIEQFEFIRVEPSTEAERRDPHTQAEALEQAADPHNRLFVVYLDHYHVNVTGSHSTRRPLVDLLERLLGPTDLFGAVTPRQRPRDIVFGRKTTSLEAQLSENWIWGLRQTWEREPEEQALESCFRWYDYDRAGRPRYVSDGVLKTRLSDLLISRRREDKVLTHLEELILYLGTLREARKAVVLFTNGWLLYEPNAGLIETIMKAQMDDEGRAPSMPGVGLRGGRLTVAEASDRYSSPSCNNEFQRLFMLDNQRRMRDLYLMANRHNVTFYPVNPSGMEIFDRAAHEQRAIDPPEALIQDMNRTTFRAETMREMAENTDGLAIITNDLAGGLRRISDDLSAYYVLGYASTNSKFDGSYRRIEVKLAKPSGLRINARRGYYAPKSSAAAPSAGPAPAATAAIPAAFADALGVLARLRNEMEVFGYGSVHDRTATIAVELAARNVGTPRWTNGADVTVSVTSLKTDRITTTRGRIEASTRGAVIPVELPDSEEKAWRVSVQVEGVPRLEYQFELRPSSGAIVGDPIVYRATPAGSSPLRIAADFQFRRNERVHVEWPMRASSDRREARLLSRLGQPLPVPLTVTETQTDGRQMIAADLVLAPLADGDYVIELIAGQGEKSERRYLAFRVVR